MSKVDIKRTARRIAMDWDGTLGIISPVYPEIDLYSPHHLYLLQYLEESGFGLVISTARPDKYVQLIADALHKQGMSLTVTNTKPDVDILVDDTAGSIDLRDTLKRINNLYPEVDERGFTDHLKNVRGVTVATNINQRWVTLERTRGHSLLGVPFHEQSLLYRVPEEYTEDVERHLERIREAEWDDGKFVIGCDLPGEGKTLNTLTRTPKDENHNPFTLEGIYTQGHKGTLIKVEPLPPTKPRAAYKLTDQEFVIYK